VCVFGSVTCTPKLCVSVSNERERERETSNASKWRYALIGSRKLYVGRVDDVDHDENQSGQPKAETLGDREEEKNEKGDFDSQVMIIKYIFFQLY
jgi:hypothetical protein